MLRRFCLKCCPAAAASSSLQLQRHLLSSVCHGIAASKQRRRHLQTTVLPSRRIARKRQAKVTTPLTSAFLPFQQKERKENLLRQNQLREKQLREKQLKANQHREKQLKENQLRQKHFALELETLDAQILLLRRRRSAFVADIARKHRAQSAAAKEMARLVKLASDPKALLLSRAVALGLCPSSSPARNSIPVTPRALFSFSAQKLPERHRHFATLDGASKERLRLAAASNAMVVEDVAKLLAEGSVMLTNDVDRCAARLQWSVELRQRSDRLTKEADGKAMDCTLRKNNRDMTTRRFFVPYEDPLLRGFLSRSSQAS